MSEPPAGPPPSPFGAFPPSDPYRPGEPTYPPPGGPAPRYAYGYPPPPTPPAPQYQLQHQPPYQPRPQSEPTIGVRLGARLLRRPEPRFSIALAGAGAALVLLGALIWGGGYYGDGLQVDVFDDSQNSGGGSRRFLGVVLFLCITAAGYAVAVARRRGPLATAGAVAAAFGAPFTLAFLTLDAGDLFRGQFPISIDAVFLVSILAWLIDYFVVPGLRGRAFLLGAAAIGLYSYVGFKVSGDGLLRAGASVAGFGGGADPGSLAGVGLVFGLGYYGIAAFLDSRGRTGAAVALAVAGFDATVGGIVVGADDFGQAGTGVLLLLVGCVLAWYGARFGRRFTTWVWSAGAAFGTLLIVAKIFDDSYTGAGVTLLVLGVLVVLGAYRVGVASREPADIEEPSGQAVPAVW